MKDSMGQKAFENLSAVGMSSYAKFAVNARRNVSVMPGHTNAQTDRQRDAETDTRRTCPYISDTFNSRPRSRGEKAGRS